MKRYTINLSDEEREELTRLTTTGRHAARKMLHAKILLKADEGLTDVKIGEHLGVGIRTIERVRLRCATEGLSAALNPKKRPHSARRIRNPPSPLFQRGSNHSSPVSVRLTDY